MSLADSLLPHDDWRRRAACLGMDPRISHSSTTQGRATILAVRQAKAVCARCSVRQQCLAYALSIETVGGESGVWGGTTPEERRSIRRRSERAGGLG